MFLLISANMASPTPSLRVSAGLRHPAAGVAVLARTLQDLGADPVPLLRECGLPEQVTGSGQPIPVEREIAFIRLAIAASGRPDLGLLAGRGHRFPVFGFWGLALAASPTLASAIRLGLQYIDLTHTFLGWRFERGEREAALVMQPAFPLGELETFLVERDAAAAAEAQCRRLLEGLSPAGGLSTRLRRLLLAHPGRLPSQDEAARRLNLSRRSLRRKLADEGTSFRALVDEVRFGLVAGYLENTGLPLDEIAARTGFSDAANLSHAFRRWTGDTPGGWRRRHGAAAPGTGVTTNTTPE
jgi:AraC-like DNA-binding protein